MKNRRNSPLLIIIALTMGVMLLFVVPGLLRARVSSSLASYRAIYQLNSMPILQGVEQIDLYKEPSVSRNTCYLGEAFSLNGTNLDMSSVGNFYEAIASKKDWNVSNKLDAHSKPYFSAVSEEKTYTVRAVEGLSIQMCDKECFLNYNFSNELVNVAMKKYKNIYIVKTWFIPFEIRNNLCGCCSGG